LEEVETKPTDLNVMEEQKEAVEIQSAPPVEATYTPPAGTTVIAAEATLGQRIGAFQESRAVCAVSAINGRRPRSSTWVNAAFQINAP